MRKLAVAALLLVACSETQVVPPPKSSSCATAVSGNEVTCDGKKFATVKTYFCFEGPCSDKALSAGDCTCRGLAVLYKDGAVAWLYRGEGLDDALVRGNYWNKSDCETKGLCHAGSIRLSPDGRHLRWWNFFKWYDYSLLEGTQRTVDDGKF